MHFQLFKDQYDEKNISNFLKSCTKNQIQSTIKSAVNILVGMVKSQSLEQKSFFSNYEKIISFCHQNNIHQSSNMTVHWINLYAQKLIQINKLNEAKPLYKAILTFCDQTSVNKILISNGLSNLSTIYRMEGKFEKSNELSFKVISYMAEEIKRISKNLQRNKQSKQQIFDCAVILVNNLALAKRNLNQLKKQLRKDSKKFKQNSGISQNINDIGYRMCLAYLGSDSQFIKFFSPIVKDPVIQVKQKIQNLESLVIDKLSKIQQLLRQRSDPPIIRTTQSQTFIEQVEQASYLQQSSIEVQPAQISIIPQPQPEQQNCQVDGLAKGLLGFFLTGNKIDEEVILMSGWEVRIQLKKLSNQNIGKLEFNCKHQSKGKQFQQKIPEQKLQKILNQQKLEQTMPYQYSLQDLPPNFISICTKPYFNITEQGQLQIYPQSIGIVKQQQKMLIQFIGKQCYITLNHIRYNHFRVSISPIQLESSLYLNVQMSDKEVSLLMELVQKAPIKLYQAFKQSHSLTNKMKKQLNYLQKSILKIKNREKINKLLQNILNKFQQFIVEQQNICSLEQIISKEDTFYKFIQSKQYHGTFFRISYLSRISCFDIYAENSYIFYSKYQQQQNKQNSSLFIHKKLRGSSQFTKKQFEQNFGIQLNYEKLQNKIKRFCEIICQKYSLPNNNKRQINEEIHNQSRLSAFSKNDQGDQNYLLEENFNFHCFNLNFAQDQQNHYKNPITASIITIHNRLPIGIKVSMYDFQTISEISYFIHIFPQDWRNSNFINCQTDKDQSQMSTNTSHMFVKYQKQYKINSKYFLSQWMKKKGFNNILKRAALKKSTDKLSLENNANQFIRWTQMFLEDGSKNELKKT